MGRLIFTLLFVLAAAGASAQEGTWKGELDIQGIKLPLVFHFAADSCTLDSPSQGVKGIKAEKTTSDDNKIRVTITAISAVFEGTNYTDSICGTFQQSGISLPLTLLPGAIETRRPQTPVPPFPYEEQQVSFTNGQFTLHGTLTLPQDCTRQTPVVLMVTGSGQQNRDEELFGHKPFAVIADALTRHGIATLRYDDRGYGDKSVTFSNYTIDDFKQDAEAGIKLLRTQFDNVGILGHSEGGTIALMLAAEHKADFAISLAGMAISGSETLLMQNRLSLSTSGLLDDMVDGYCAALKEAFTSLREGKSPEGIKLSTAATALQPTFDRALQQLRTPYMQHFLTLNISSQLSLIQCPVLALNGKKDMQVDCDANLTALEKGLTNNSHHTIHALEDLNHLFQHCATGNVIEYQQIEETISPAVLEMIAEWINGIRTNISTGSR